MKRFVVLFVSLSALPLAAFAHGPGYGGYGYGGYGYGYGYGGYGVSKNGPPSQAAQMQQQQSDAFMARGQQANRPSPALRYEQAPPSRRYDSLDDTSIVPIPESQRHPFVEEHYPAPPLWQRGPYWMWERGPVE